MALKSLYKMKTYSRLQEIMRVYLASISAEGSYIRSCVSMSGGFLFHWRRKKTTLTRIYPVPFDLFVKNKKIHFENTRKKKDKKWGHSFINYTNECKNKNRINEGEGVNVCEWTGGWMDGYNLLKVFIRVGQSVVPPVVLLF